MLGEDEWMVLYYIFLICTLFHVMNQLSRKLKLLSEDKWMVLYYIYNRDHRLWESFWISIWNSTTKTREREREREVPEDTLRARSATILQLDQNSRMFKIIPEQNTGFRLPCSQTTRTNFNGYSQVNCLSNGWKTYSRWWHDCIGDQYKNSRSPTSLSGHLYILFHGV